MYYLKVILLLCGVLTVLKIFITELEGGAAAPSPHQARCLRTTYKQQQGLNYHRGCRD